MNRLRKVGWVAVMRARQQLLCWRSAAVFILMGIFMFSYAQPFSDFARERGLEITPYAAVFIMDDIIAQLFLMLGAVALCAGAPFLDEQYPYLVARCGRCTVVLGNILAILGLTGLYVAFLYLASVAPMADTLAWDHRWGKVWNTLALSHPHVEGSMIAVSDAIRSSLTPRRALLIGLLLEWGCAGGLGLVVYWGNRLSGKPLGLWIAAGFVMLDTTIYNILPARLQRYSPLSLARLSVYKNRLITFSYGYGGCFLVGMALALSAVLLIQERLKKDLV